MGHDEGQLNVSAAIWVDRAGRQKPIVIGAGGERLKRVGRKARLELNHVLGRTPAPDFVGEGARELGRQRPGADRAGPGMSATTRRTLLAQAYVLHAHPLSRHQPHPGSIHPRAGAVVGIRPRRCAGPRRGWHRCCSRSDPLLISFTARGDSAQLVSAESPAADQADSFVGSLTGALPPAALMSGFYLNELLMKLTLRHDPNSAVFDAYAQALAALASDASQEPALRNFELTLLQELGYGLDLTQTVAGTQVTADGYYHFRPADGLFTTTAEHSGALKGSSLLNPRGGRACARRATGRCPQGTRRGAGALPGGAADRHAGGGARLHRHRAGPGRQDQSEMNHSTIRLGINIDHVATVRQARPRAVSGSGTCGAAVRAAGADSITVHLREDRRHIQDRDVRALRPLLQTRMNLEMAVTEEMLAIACELRPADCCLVPEKARRGDHRGWAGCGRPASASPRGAWPPPVCGCRCSSIRSRARSRPRPASSAPRHRIAHRRLCRQHRRAQAAELSRLQASAQLGARLGLSVHAGHGLHYHNVQPVAAIREIVELNIGHAIVARAIFSGLPSAVRDMKALMLAARV